MFDHFIFIIYLYLFLLSTLGHGVLFSKIFQYRFLEKNIGYLGLIGFFSLSVYSILSSYFIPHNFIHNFCIHFLGITSLVLYIKTNRYRLRQLKYFLILSVFLLISSYVFKNHDDFPYYHLTYSLNLSENSFIIGTGIFSHGFRTFSSLFYYHSLLYMPIIQFYLFHIGPFFILVFFNFIFIKKIIKNRASKNIDFVFYFSLLSLIFVNVVFYRIGEHGTDRSAQILLLIIFTIFFELILKKRNPNEDLNQINLLILLIFLASSMKAIYYLYFLIIPILLLNKKMVIFYFKRIKFFLFFIFLLSISLNLITNYFNTGCLLYPAKLTCVGSPIWQLPLEEVEKMKIHYEWWSKAGGGPGYISEIPKEKYVQNFTWLSNWIDRHFFNKVSDTLLGIIFICFILVTILLFFSKKRKKQKIKIPLYIYFIPLLFLLEWFFNHPSMRYGGYVLFAIPLFMLTSSYVSKIDINFNKVFKISISLIILSIIIFNFRNILRINHESKIYGYDIKSSPFFYVDKVSSEPVYEKDNFRVFTTVDNKQCWASKTPCSYYKSIKVENFLWMKVVLRNVE